LIICINIRKITAAAIAPGPKACEAIAMNKAMARKNIDNRIDTHS